MSREYECWSADGKGVPRRLALAFPQGSKQNTARKYSVPQEVEVEMVKMRRI